jgi:hypothetical protein
MAKSRKSRQSRKSRSRKYKSRGGAYSFTGASIGAPGTISNYGQAWETTGKPLTPDCVAATKSDIMGYSGPAGLPGLSGGRRRKQTGGRYGFDLSSEVAPSGGPSLGGIPPVQRIACEGSTPNPLNPGPHTPSTQPPVQGGGAQLGGLGSPDLAYYAPTAGYANAASSWVSSVGAPVQIQVPYEARAWNPACLKTGGGNNNDENDENNNNNNNNNMDGGKRKKKAKKSSRKTRKGKKGSRKH